MCECSWHLQEYRTLESTGLPRNLTYPKLIRNLTSENGGSGIMNKVGRYVRGQNQSNNSSTTVASYLPCGTVRRKHSVYRTECLTGLQHLCSSLLLHLDDIGKCFEVRTWCIAQATCPLDVTNSNDGA